MQKLKRVLSIFTVLAMLLGVMSVSALAADETDPAGSGDTVVVAVVTIEESSGNDTDKDDEDKDDENDEDAGDADDADNGDDANGGDGDNGDNADGADDADGANDADDADANGGDGGNDDNATGSDDAGDDADADENGDDANENGDDDENGDDEPETQTLMLVFAPNIQAAGLDAAQLGASLVATSKSAAPAAQALPAATNTTPAVPVATTATVSSEAELKAALANENIQTIELGGDFSIDQFIDVSRSVTINGNGKTVTANDSATRLLRVTTGGVQLNLNGVVFDGDGKAERGVQVDSGLNATLSMDGCTIKNVTYYAINMMKDTAVAIDIKDSDIAAWGALNLWGENYTVNVSNSTLKGVNNKGYNADGWNDFATVVLEGDTTEKTTLHAENCVVNLDNCTVIATTVPDAKRNNSVNAQSCVGFNIPSAHNKVNITGDATRFIYTTDRTDLQYGAHTEGSNSSTQNYLVISGGTFSSDDIIPYLASGYGALQTVDAATGETVYRVYKIVPIIPVSTNDDDDDDDDDTPPAPETPLDIPEDLVPLAGLPEDFVIEITAEEAADYAATLGIIADAGSYDAEAEVAGSSVIDALAAVAAAASSEAVVDMAAITEVAGIDFEAPVTCEQMVTALFTLAEAQGFDVTARTELAQLTDAENISEATQAAVEWAVSVGLLTDEEADLLALGGTMTQEQMVLLLLRYMELTK